MAEGFVPSGLTHLNPVNFRKRLPLRASRNFALRFLPNELRNAARARGAPGKLLPGEGPNNLPKWCIWVIVNKLRKASYERPPFMGSIHLYG